MCASLASRVQLVNPVTRACKEKRESWEPRELRETEEGLGQLDSKLAIPQNLRYLFMFALVHLTRFVCLLYMRSI